MRPLILCAFLAACATRKPAETGPETETAAPQTVRAYRYKVEVYDSALHYSHRIGRWIEEIYFPSHGVVCNVDFGGFFGGPGRLNAFSSGPRNGDDALEEIEVPADLAADIIDMAQGRVFSRHPDTIANELFGAELLRAPGVQGVTLEA
jgi:hypothetical protein